MFLDVFFLRYGFRTPPHLELKARPKLGEREVTLAHVTDWIEKKLYQEFQVLLLTLICKSMHTVPLEVTHWTDKVIRDCDAEGKGCMVFKCHI